MLKPIYKIYLFLFALLFSTSCSCITTNEPSCFFIPPPDWDFADPKILAPRVKVAFVGKTKQALAPSVILAVEEIKVGLPEYLKAVQTIYEKTRKTSWRSMGFIKTKAGPAQLMQIDTETKYGPLRKLQLIFIKENKAYVLTTTALKKEFSTHSAVFYKVLSSFSCTHDLYASIPQEVKTDLEKLETALLKKWSTLQKTGFEEMFNQIEFQKSYWLPLQKKVLEDCQELGAYWQLMVLRSIREQLCTSSY